MMTMFGIRNCDTVKKARAWLDERGIAYDFHDYKTKGIDRGRLEEWCAQFGWEAVCNRAGTTYRRLPDADRQGLNQERAIALMMAQPSLIKRPILDAGGQWILGFTPASYALAVPASR